MKAKIFWMLCLVLALSLFLGSLVSQNLWLLLLAGILATVTYFKGDDVLFGEYNKKRALKRKQLREILDARRNSR